MAKHQNCHFWELKEELKRTEKNLKELKLSNSHVWDILKKNKNILDPVYLGGWLVGLKMYAFT